MAAGFAGSGYVAVAVAADSAGGVLRAGEEQYSSQRRSHVVVAALWCLWSCGDGGAGGDDDSVPKNSSVPPVVLPRHLVQKSPCSLLLFVTRCRSEAPVASMETTNLNLNSDFPSRSSADPPWLNVLYGVLSRDM